MISTALAFAMYGLIVVGLVVHARYQARKRRTAAPPPPLPLRRPWKQVLPVGHPDLKYHTFPWPSGRHGRRWNAN